MPGITKRKYEAETTRIAKSLTRPLNLIVETLKPGYSSEELLQAFKEYYPFEWEKICERYQVYSEKDMFLLRNGKKKRYNPLKPEVFFFRLPKVKHLLSDGFKEKHNLQYDEQQRLNYEEKLKNKRMVKIEKRSVAIRTNAKKMQQVDPGFIDALVYAYHKKENTTDDKMEICKEILKYDCDKTWEFFWKTNDSERNDQIRNYAFRCLQKSGHYVKLRKRFKGKKKQYMTERSAFQGTPEGLAIRLRDSHSVQNIKSFDLFISHSYKDKEIVSDVVRKANKHGLNCYVDWTADNDFLKRSLVSDYTKEVLKARMKQSKKLLFLSSVNSRESEWVAFELQYYQKDIQNEILMILIDGEDTHGFKRIDTEELNGIFEEGRRNEG